MFNIGEGLVGVEVGVVVGRGLNGQPFNTDSFNLMLRRAISNNWKMVTNMITDSVSFDHISIFCSYYLHRGLTDVITQLNLSPIQPWRSSETTLPL